MQTGQHSSSSLRRQVTKGCLCSMAKGSTMCHTMLLGCT
jgi:hypothetical protein